MMGTLEWCWHLALTKEEETIDPAHPEWKMKSLALEDSLSEVRDSEGRLVFVDDDGHCFVHSADDGWVEVKVNITVTVTPLATKKENLCETT
jgi:hypothetical protein